MNRANSPSQKKSFETRFRHHLVTKSADASSLIILLGRVCRRMMSACLLCMLASAAVHAAGALESTGSGVFVNDRGDVLTSRGAVAMCDSPYVVKDGRVVRAAVLAISDSEDIAVLSTRLKPYLTATFAHTPNTGSGGKPVFSESYDALENHPAASTMFNALTVPGGGLWLLSGVQPGFGGSAVLNGDGLLLGMVTDSVTVALRQGVSPFGFSNGASHVKAVSSTGITDFLRSHGIPFSESDVPQLESTQALAPRATTLAVGVICG
jgi:serine protease DegQ